jgi:hypothetical protein
LSVFVELGTFYNSSYFFVGLILLVGAGIIVGWRKARPQTILLVLWFLPMFILLAVILRLPGTHFYLLMPSWSLLAALPLASLTEQRALPAPVRWALLGLVAVWLAVSTGYLYLAFFRQDPEYVVNYGEERLSLFPAPYGKNVPLDPRFGFPIHEGWKALGLLARWGCLQGTFASNEGSRFHEHWYLQDLTRVGQEDSPDYIFVAKHVQAPNWKYDESLADGYQPVASVQVREEARIEVLTRQPVAAFHTTYPSEEFALLFDRTVPALEDGPGMPLQVRGEELGSMVTLESVGLAQTSFRPGDTIHLLLVWRPQVPLPEDYKLFVHVAGEGGRPVAQWDGHPCFNLGRTSQWPPGASIVDHVLVATSDELLPGEYTLLAGMYDETSGERLGGRAIEIGRITVY